MEQFEKNNIVAAPNIAVSLVGTNPPFPKPYRELTLGDDFLFGHIMRQREPCRDMLRLLLNQPHLDIDEPTAQRVIRAGPSEKWVRLDVQASNKTQMFDVEMQHSPGIDLPLRSRYYQSIMDVEALQSGQLYRKLKTNWVIFLCKTDLFGKGLPRYTFQNRCNERPSCILGDKTIKIFYNCSEYAKIKDTDVSSFLEYLYSGHAATSFTQSLDQLVTKARERPDWEKGYMDYYQGSLLLKEEGMELGMRQAKMEGARNLLREHVGTPEQIAHWLNLTEAQIAQLAREIQQERP